MSRNPSTPDIKNFPASKQRRLDELLEKNCNGTITAREKELLSRLVDEAEKLMVANSKRMLQFAAAVPNP